MMILVALTAFVMVAFLAIDRWTATTWNGKPNGMPLTFVVVDADTGKAPANVTPRLMILDKEGWSDHYPATLVHLIGYSKIGGYRSRLRDTRRLTNVDVLGIRVTADGFEDLSAGPEQIAREARLSADESEMVFLMRLRRVVTDSTARSTGAQTE
jgi:hypothetical protein